MDSIANRNVVFLMDARSSSSFMCDCFFLINVEEDIFVINFNCNVYKILLIFGSFVC